MISTIQNDIKLSRAKLNLEPFKSLILREGQTFLLAPKSEERIFVRLSFIDGIARVSGSFGDQIPDITLAFCGDSEDSCMRLPIDMNLLLEALTDSRVDIHYTSECPGEKDHLWQWLFDFHLVRHPVGAEARLISLLQLLVSRFGIRRADGYLLPFAVGHARMAELIGATRSTVTRQITFLRNQSDLQIVEPQGLFLLSQRLMESSSNWIS